MTQADRQLRFTSIDVGCPTCLVLPGEDCTSSLDHPHGVFVLARPHSTRADAARELTTRAAAGAR